MPTTQHYAFLLAGSGPTLPKRNTVALEKRVEGRYRYDIEEERFPCGVSESAKTLQ